MNMRIYVYANIYIYIHKDVYIYIHKNVYIYVYIYIYLNLNISGRAQDKMSRRLSGRMCQKKGQNLFLVESHKKAEYMPNRTPEFNAE